MIAKSVHRVSTCARTCAHSHHASSIILQHPQAHVWPPEQLLGDASGMPPEVFDRISYYNVPVTASPGAKFNPLRASHASNLSTCRISASAGTSSRGRAASS